MAAPTKKRACDNIGKDGFREDSSDSDSSDDESPNSTERINSQEQIQVDFEGRNPIDSDFHGIKQLLHQLFLKAQINLSELTDLLIGQNYVGSVIKQSFDVNDEESDDEDEGDSGSSDVFGITSVVNLTEKQNVECVSQLRKLLLELSREHGTDETVSFVENLLQDDVRPVGLIINERFINIPAQITIPLLRGLSGEMKKAVAKKMPYEFGYFVLICKLYKLDGRKKKQKKKGNADPDILWSNPEEEFIEPEADLSFEFSVKSESDTGLSGQWKESDSEMTPFRKVLIFKAEKLDSIIDKVDKVVNVQ